MTNQKIVVRYNDLASNAIWTDWGEKEKNMYEYVKRSEYQPIRLELEGVIRKVHHYMREKYNLERIWGDCETLEINM